MFQCPQCHTEFEAGTRFCSICGLDLEKEFIVDPVCPVCGKTFAAGTKYCDGDGAILVPVRKMIPTCVVCNTVFTGGEKFCPKDGGAIIPEALRGSSRPAAARSAGFGARAAGQTPLASGAPRDLEALIRDGYQVNVGDYFGQGFEIFKRNIGGFLGFSGVVVLLTVVTFFVNFMLGFVLAIIPVLGPLIAMPLSIAVNLVVVSLETAAVYLVAFRIIRGQEVEFGDFFKVTELFVPVALAGLMVGFATFLGYLMLILPGIFLAVCLKLTMPLIVDRKLRPTEAIGISFKIALKNWLGLFLLALVVGLLQFAGVICLGIGLLFTIPFGLCILAAAYNDIIGLTPAESPGVASARIPTQVS